MWGFVSDERLAMLLIATLFNLMTFQFMVVMSAKLRLNADIYEEGNVLKASCLSLSDKSDTPPTWFLDGRLVKGESCSEEVPPWNFCLRVKQEHNGKILTCLRENASMKSKVNESQEIHVFYLQLSLDSYRYNTGDTMTATCLLKNALHAQVSWYIDGFLIENVKNTRNLSHEFKLSRIIGKGDNGKNLSCVAKIDGLNAHAKSSRILNVRQCNFNSSAVNLYTNKEVFTEGDILRANSSRLGCGRSVKVTWFLDSKLLADCPDNDGSDVCFKINKTHDNSELRLVFEHPSLDEALTVRKIIKVFYVELQFDKRSYEVGETMNVVCHVRNSVEADVLWFQDDNLVKKASGPSMTINSHNNSLDARCIAEMEIKDSNTVFSCRVHIPGKNLNATDQQILHVECPVTDNKSLIDDALLAEDQIFKATASLPDCTAPSNVQWFLDGQEARENLCKFDFQSLCLNVSRTFHNKKLRCVFENPIQKKNVTIEKVLQVTYVDLILPSSERHVGEDILATCIVRNTLKTTVYWYLGNEILNIASPRTMTLDFTNNNVNVTLVRNLEENDNGKRLRCLAVVDGTKFTIDDSEVLRVKRLPDIQLQVHKNWYRGGDLLIASCSVRSDPQSTISWSFGEDGDNETTRAVVMTALDGTVVAEFRRRLTRGDNGKVLTCIAEYGQTRTNKTLLVFFKDTNDSSLTIEVVVYVIIGVLGVIICGFIASLTCNKFAELYCDNLKMRETSNSSTYNKLCLSMASSTTGEHVYEEIHFSPDADWANFNSALSGGLHVHDNGGYLVPKSVPKVTYLEILHNPVAEARNRDSKEDIFNSTGLASLNRNKQMFHQNLF